MTFRTLPRYVVKLNFEEKLDALLNLLCSGAAKYLDSTDNNVGGIKLKH